MLNGSAAVLLFMSSFSPLFVMFALRSETWWLQVPLAIVGILGLAGSIVVTDFVARTAPQEVEVADVAPRDAETVSYLVTYLLPFLVAPSARWQDLAALGCFLLVLGVLYVKSNMVYINPVLALRGYHLWSLELVSSGRKEQCWLLSGRTTVERGHIQAVRLLGNVWLQAR